MGRSRRTPAWDEERGLAGGGSEEKAPLADASRTRRGRGDEADDAKEAQREEVEREVGDARSASPDDRDERSGARPTDEDRRAARGLSRTDAATGNDRGGRARGKGPGEAKGPGPDPRQGESIETAETPPEA